jgi:hypothetical protein
MYFAESLLSVMHTALLRRRAPLSQPMRRMFAGHAQVLALGSKQLKLTEGLFNAALWCNSALYVLPACHTEAQRPC